MFVGAVKSDPRQKEVIDVNGKNDFAARVAVPTRKSAKMRHVAYHDDHAISGCLIVDQNQGDSLGEVKAYCVKCEWAIIVSIR